MTSFGVGFPQVSGRQRWRPQARLRRWAALALLIGVAFAPAAQARLARLDTSFGHRGVLTVSLPGLGLQPSRVAVLPNGSIVGLFTAFSPGRIVLIRFHSNGSIDRTFGHNGFVITSVVKGFFPEGMTIAPDGRILVVGVAFVSNTPVVSAAAVVRYLANGALDHSFGTGGVLLPTAPPIGRDAAAVLVQHDRKIVIGATANPSGFLLARYDANGKHLDSTFDGDGIATIASDAGGCGVSSESGVANLTAAGPWIIADGICGSTTTTISPGLARFRVGPTANNGGMDATFGTGGIAMAPFTHPSFDSGVVRRADGTLVQLVQIGYGGATARAGVAGYTASGASDPHFGSGGAAMINAGSVSNPTGIAGALDGKLLVASFDGGDRGVFALIRLTANGKPDMTFAPGARLVVRVGEQGPGVMSQSGAFGLTVAPDGRVIEYGTSHQNGQKVATLVRFGVPPTLVAARVSHRKLSYRVSQAARTTITVIAVRHGRHTVLGSFLHRDRIGKNSVRLPGKVDGHKLRRGRYILALTPVADGLIGAPVTVRFKL